jgi:hypothetical protein
MSITGLGGVTKGKRQSSGIWTRRWSTGRGFGYRCSDFLKEMGLLLRSRDDTEMRFDLA